MEIQSRIAEHVRDYLAQCIIEAEGNEIFAVGTINAEGIVVSALTAARGNKDSVPVNQSAAREGSVLIHNHPGGNLQPSAADLQVASRTAANAQGFYIINNNVTDVYVVVEPVKAAVIRKLNAEETSKLISSGGSLSSFSSFFEEREGQIALLKAVCESFNKNEIGVFEAGTGTGKSFAYLIPAVQWAVSNKERVVISTGTINLQQQLFEKDIPAAQKITGSEVKAVLMKGRQQYVCMRRLTDALKEQDLFSDETEELEKIAAWTETSATGSRSDLSYMPTENVWQRINSESDACMGMRCVYHDQCFVMKTRKEAADAQILVVNHHLLFANVETRLSGIGFDDTAVLPPYKRVIFDEAHGIESAATSFFSETVTRFKFIKQLNLLYRFKKNASAGLLFSIESLSSHADCAGQAASLIDTIKNNIQDLDKAALEMMSNEYTFRINENTSPRCSDVFHALDVLRSSIAELTALIREIIEGIDEEDRDAPAVWEVKQILRRIEAAGSLCKNFGEWSERKDTVFWIEKKRMASSEKYKLDSVWYPRFVQTPLEIGSTMNAGVFEPLNTVICTSATLTIGHDFSFWKKRTGLYAAEQERIVCAEYPSPFPYDKNMLLIIPTDVPLPDNSSYQPCIDFTVPLLIRAAGGRTLVLCTSYDSLRSVYEASRLQLARDNITLLKQGDDDRFRLLETFKNDTSSVLFATDSFWEGVDVPGESLSQVIILKIPFSVPSDPVFAARAEAVEKKGGNSFMELSVPEAVIRFRQGVGRLMRRTTDRGVVCILDKRIIEKRYGRFFLDSLPETKKKIDVLDECILASRRFLASVL